MNDVEDTSELTILANRPSESERQRSIDAKVHDAMTDHNPLRQAEVTFYEELQEMPYLERCIVLGVVMGEAPATIADTLKLTKKEMQTYLIGEKALIRWDFYRKLIDA